MVSIINIAIQYYYLEYKIQNFNKETNKDLIKYKKNLNKYKIIRIYLDFEKRNTLYPYLYNNHFKT